LKPRSSTQLIFTGSSPARREAHRGSRIGHAEVVEQYQLALAGRPVFREPDVQLGFLWGSGWLTMGMLLCIPLILAGIVLLAFVMRNKTAMNSKPIVKDG